VLVRLMATIVAAVLGFAAPAFAQDFPTKPVKIVVPFPPGALTDTLARMLATRLSEKWGQPVIVENRAGAAGNIGTESVYRAPPDGYTLLFTPQQPLVLSKLMSPDVPFDPDQFTPIAIVTRSTVLMLVNPKVPAENVQQLIAHASANPGKLNFATSGVGGTAHLANELFFALSRTKGTNVPYQGIAPAVTSLLAGETDVLFDAMGNSLPNVKAGRLRVIGIASGKRVAPLPDVPTVAETLPGFESGLWTAMAAPPKTPAALAEKISADVAQALKHPDFVARFAATPGLEPAGTTPADMARITRDERERWARIIKATGIKAE
jgi:tripartite-type tricarboxylate transporter receptor subunit TctC